MKNNHSPGTSGDLGLIVGGCFSLFLMSVTFLTALGLGWWLL